MPSIGRLRDFKYARLGEGRRFGFVLQKLFSYWDWPQTCLIFALILANFSFKGHVHKICVEGFQICEVGRLEEVWFLPTKYNIICYNILFMRLTSSFVCLLYSCPIFCKISFVCIKYVLQDFKYARLRDWIGESERSCGRGFVRRRCYKIFARLKRSKQSKLGGLQCHTCRISMWNFKTLPFFHETLVKKKECWKRRVESRRCNISPTFFPSTSWNIFSKVW